MSAPNEEPISHSISECLQLLLSADPSQPITDQLYTEVMRDLMNGQFHPTQAGALLTLLNTRPYTSSMLAALAITMRSFSKPLEVLETNPDLIIDIVGTGGDGFDTFNASTAAALIVAAVPGCRVVKHGNRAVTSQCGSADFLEALGARLEPAIGPARVAETSGFGFVYAPAFHPAMKHVMPVRKALRGIRTVFNVLGPLTNPACPSRMLAGVYRRDLGPLYAECLMKMGVKKGLVVHGEEGLDEISPEKETLAWMIDRGVVTPMKLSPLNDFGIEPHPLAEMTGGTKQDNVELFLKLIDPEPKQELSLRESHLLDFILLNAAAAIFIADRASSLKDAVQIARSVLADGSVQRVVERFVAASNAALSSTNILDEIVARRSQDVVLEQNNVELAHSLLEAQLATRSNRAFDLLMKEKQSHRLVLMAEFKRRSPSRGNLLPEGVSLESQTRAYVQGGARVLSILTEPRYFNGSYEDLIQTRALVGPEPLLLLKDFVLHEWQMVRAAAAGADLVLLLARVLSPSRLEELIVKARSLGLEPLVEIHSSEELDIVLKLDARVIGINVRDLKTFQLDRSLVSKIVDQIPASRREKLFIAALSGVRTARDIPSQIDAILVGETLMCASSPKRMCQQLLQAEERPLIKMCGLKDAQSMRLVLEHDVDLIGMVFASHSKRCVSLTQAQQIVAETLGSERIHQRRESLRQALVPSTLETHVEQWYMECAQRLRWCCTRVGPLLVGVFVDEPIETINKIAKAVPLDLVQLHRSSYREGDETIACPVIRALEVDAEGTALTLPEPRGSVVALLLDRQGGGTGQRFVWDHPQVQAVLQRVPCLVAGGLNADNVKQAIQQMNPLGVDVASGIDNEQLGKDEKRITAFVKAVEQTKK